MNESNLHRCIYSGEEITEDNNSKAHIFPNAIGGKLKPKNILTIQSNGGKLKDIEDNFLSTFKELLALIDPVRDRGAAPRHQYTSKLKTKYMQSRGGTFMESVRTNSANYNKKHDGHKIIFGNKPTIERCQSYDFTKIMPALYVFSIMFAAYKGQKIGESFKYFVDHPSTIINNANIHLCNLSTLISRDDNSIRHAAMIFHGDNKKTTFVYIEIFGIIATLTYLPYIAEINPSGYWVDITSGTDKEFIIDTNFYENLNYVRIEDYVSNVINASMEKLLLKIRNQQFYRLIAETLKEAVGNGKYSADEFKIRLQGAYDWIEQTYKSLKIPTITNK